MTAALQSRVLYNLPVRALKLLFVLVPFFGLSASTQTSPIQSTGFDSNLRGVSVSKTHSGKYAMWVSGTKGIILRSLDDGKSWKQLKVEGVADLDFRDIESFGETTAYVMSSGDGEKSRIYKTVDGGRSWTLQYTDKRAGFFLDALACDSRTHCFALSDPVEGKFLILTTSDGEHWKELPHDKMPAALPTEGAFAASGTSIALCGNKDIFFGTGGPAARVFHSADRRRSWTAAETPMASGNASSGIFSVACHGRSLVAVGGDYREPARTNKVAIYSTDSGATWHLADQQPGGYRSAVAFLSGRDFVAVGTNGTDISHDAGVHWTHMDALNLNAVTFAAARGWAAGPKGTVARFGERSH
ncbi:MAG: hypothetical protein LAO30_24730 [Acidobacteriia bacterium]|nr:hypothetical protein [Terriglobia bacterium]